MRPGILSVLLLVLRATTSEARMKTSSLSISIRHEDTTIVAPATTTHRGYSFEVVVRADESDFKEDSSVRVDQIRTIDMSDRIQFVAGRLPPAVMREIDDALKIELDLD